MAYEKKVKEIIERKKKGTDCTEAESAEIKGFIKDNAVSVEHGDVEIVEDIQTYFPNEYGEALDEMEKNPRFEKGGEISDIEKAKQALIKKAKSKGLYENFGQKEVRSLQDKYGYTDSIRQFDDWASNFDLSQMEKGGNAGKKGSSFLGDEGTMMDFWEMSREEFLKSNKYYGAADYDATLDEYLSGVVVFDNNGDTYDQYTILNKKTGDIYGASENPFSPTGFGQHSHNVTDRLYTTMGSNWQRGHTEKSLRGILASEEENWINDMGNNKNIGKEVEDLNSLPEKVKEYIKKIQSEDKMEKGGKTGKDKPYASKAIKKRLEELRKELRAEKLSWGELHELQSLSEYIDPSDVELLEAAGVPEFPDDDSKAKGGSMATGGGVESKDELIKEVERKGRLISENHPSTKIYDKKLLGFIPIESRMDGRMNAYQYKKKVYEITAWNNGSKEIRIADRDRIRDYKEEGLLESGGSMATGGGVDRKSYSDYEGKTPEQIWNEWTVEQREHFIEDSGLGLFSWGSYAKEKWSELPYSRIQKPLEKHIKRGQYEKGGNIATIKHTMSNFWNSFCNDGAIITGGCYFNGDVEKKDFGGAVLGLLFGLGTGYIAGAFVKQKGYPSKLKTDSKGSYMWGGADAGWTEISDKEFSILTKGNLYKYDPHKSIWKLKIFEKGGDTSGRARDRKYTSQQEHELNYKDDRKSRVRYYQTHEKGGTTGKKIILIGLSKHITEDSYEEGQDPDTNRNVMYEKNLGSFDSADDLLKFLNKNYGLSEDKKDYTAFEDGRITYGQMEDEDGNKVDSDDSIYKKFEKGEVKLWAADFDIYIEVGEIKTPNVNEIAKMFGIQKYEKGGSIYGKKYGLKKVRMTKRGHGIDSKVRALPAGWRKSKETGDWYYENRENRADKRPSKKL